MTMVFDKKTVGNLARDFFAGWVRKNIDIMDLDGNKITDLPL